MKLVYVASFLTALLFIGFLPFKALAEMHEVQTIPPIVCGPRCVLETFKFDSYEEAKLFADKYEVKAYQSDTQEWFVSIQLTEVQANVLN